MAAISVILLWLHLMAIALAGASVFGIPVVGRVMRAESAEIGRASCRERV